MNVVITNEIKDDVFSSVVTIESFGDISHTAEEELAMLDNFSSKVVYRNLTFTGKFKVVEGLPVLSEDEDAEELSIRLTNQEIPIDANFNATYKTSLKNTLDSEVGTILNTKILVCEAKCILFASVIKAELKRIMEDLRTKAIGFEGTTEEIV